MSKIFILILSIILILLTIISYFLPQKYYLMYIFIYLIVIIFAVLTLPKYYKLASLLILYIYWRNLYLMISLFLITKAIVIEYPVDTRDNDDVVRNMVSGCLSTVFRLSHNFANIPNHPTIYIANYSHDRIEHITLVMIPTKICALMGKGFINMAKTNYIMKNSLTMDGSGNFDKVKDSIDEMLRNGVSVIAYVEKRLLLNKLLVGRLRTGIFKIAKELNRTITPIVFDHIYYNSYGVIPKQNYSIMVGKTTKVENIDRSIYETRLFMKKSLYSMYMNKII